MRVYWRKVRRGENLILSDENDGHEEELGGSETPNGASTRRRRLSATTRAAPGRGSHLSKKPRISWSPSDLGSYSVPRALLSTLGLGPPWIRPQPFDWQEERMPIRKEMQQRYPKDWALRSRFVRFYRAKPKPR